MEFSSLTRKKHAGSGQETENQVGVALFIYHISMPCGLFGNLHGAVWWLY